MTPQQILGTLRTDGCAQDCIFVAERLARQGLHEEAAILYNVAASLQQMLLDALPDDRTQTRAIFKMSVRALMERTATAREAARQTPVRDNDDPHNLQR